MSKGTMITTVDILKMEKFGVKSPATIRNLMKDLRVKPVSSMKYGRGHLDFYSRAEIDAITVQQIERVKARRAMNSAATGKNNLIPNASGVAAKESLHAVMAQLQRIEDKLDSLLFASTNVQPSEKSIDEALQESGLPEGVIQAASGH